MNCNSKLQIRVNFWTRKFQQNAEYQFVVSGSLWDYQLNRNGIWELNRIAGVFKWLELKEMRSNNRVWVRQRGVNNCWCLDSSIDKKNDMKNWSVREEKDFIRILHKLTLCRIWNNSSHQKSIKLVVFTFPGKAHVVG